MSSFSDLSATAHALPTSSTISTVSTRPQMDVVCVIDINETHQLAHRKKAFEEVKLVCENLGANLHHIQVNIKQNYANKVCFM